MGLCKCKAKTTTMAFSNKHSNIYKKWLQYAEADLEVAQMIYRSAIRKKQVNWPVYMLIIWHCQQVVEKMLKMVILLKGKELPYIHDLPRLLAISEIEDFPPEFEHFIDELTHYYIKPRYPDLPATKSYPKANKQIAQEYVHKTL